MNLIYGSCGLGFENNFLLKFSDIYSSFQNDICPGTGDIDGRSGVCWTKEECAELNGIADGGCASGYGVCCICKCKFLGLPSVPIFILDVHCMALSGPCT